MGYGGGSGEDCMVGACGWLCCSHELVSGGSRGFRRPCRSVPLAPPPPTNRGQGLWIVPAFVCLPTPPHPLGDRDLSTCLVLSPPDQGGDVCYYRLRALVSTTLWAVLPFWHCLVSGTPSLSYMNCPELVQCAPPPLCKLKNRLPAPQID